MNRRDFFRSSLATAVAASLGGRSALAALAPVTTDLEAVTGNGAKVTLTRTALEELRDSLRGALLLPGQPGYDEARRVLNASIDKHPALVVQPSGPADVRTAVDFAHANALLLAVKVGGHSYGGKSTCDGRMQIDLSRFRGVRVDPAARVAYVAGGSLLGELDHEAMSLGLVTTAGTVSHTGVGGLTLGGGFGRLGRRYGLALDNLIAVDIVTADGRLLRASAEENPDLFWGVRGGGGNFGVVTGFEFRLHPTSCTSTPPCSHRRADVPASSRSRSATRALPARPSGRWRHCASSASRCPTRSAPWTTWRCSVPPIRAMPATSART